MSWAGARHLPMLALPRGDATQAGPPLALGELLGGTTEPVAVFTPGSGGIFIARGGRAAGGEKEGQDEGGDGRGLVFGSSGWAWAT